MINKPRLLHIEIFSYLHETIRNIVSSPLPSLDWKHVYQELLAV